LDDQRRVAASPHRRLAKLATKRMGPHILPEMSRRSPRFTPTTKGRKRPHGTSMTQRTRQSPRGETAGLSDLATRIAVRGERVVFITGAGLSVASGIRPFRKSSDSKAAMRGVDGSEPGRARSHTTGAPKAAGLWDEVIWTTATRATFRKDPTSWYNDFWLSHFAHPGTTANGAAPRPNAGHVALEALLSAFPNVQQITQNIDGLQAPSKRLIEAHGRVGLYKCVPSDDSDTDSDEDDDHDRPVHLGNRRKAKRVRDVANRRRKNGVRKGCHYQYLESLQAGELEPPAVRAALLSHGKTGASPAPLPSAPRCPFCNNLALPQALLFDEGYHSHSFYEFAKMEEWLAAADVLVFVGTSFAVQLTQTALQWARDKPLAVYNLNTVDLITASHRLDVTNIVGPASVSLAQLVATCRSLEDQQPAAPTTSPPEGPRDIAVVVAAAANGLVPLVTGAVAKVRRSARRG
jgi:NAD-dependent deacetylase